MNEKFKQNYIDTSIQKDIYVSKHMHRVLDVVNVKRDIIKKDKAAMFKASNQYAEEV